MGLISETESPRGAALAGGVSSDIWRADLASGPVCIKTALPRLKVAAEWQVPVERNRHELRWIETVSRILPVNVPKIRGVDEASCSFAMDYLDPGRFPVWKEMLGKGRVDLDFATATGAALAAIHNATAGVSAIREEFATDSIFRAIRLDPYLGATAKAHPDLADALHALIRKTAATKLALVHGDVSPKNILAGPSGPVFLDAECAWYGDPAFDLAFCLNHLLLKCLWVPAAAPELLNAFHCLSSVYLERAGWEHATRLEERAAHLLPGLMLARVDGKSPVEYLAEPEKSLVRRCARALLAAPVHTLGKVAAAFARELQG